MQNLKYFTWSIGFTVFGLVGGYLIGGLAIVGVVASLGPVEVVDLALFNPDEYARLLTSAHHEIAAFGGAFLMMVFLKFFIDENKDTHWLARIESPLTKLGRLEAAQILLTLLAILATSAWIDGADKRMEFIVAGVWGLIVYIAADGLGAIMGGEEGEGGKMVAKTGFAGFMYLELLDASFSFDGVIGAFALTTSLPIIAIGLGVGAMFVRSFTLMLVYRGTLEAYRYLEHGAFWAIGALAAIMFVGVHMHIPETFTGLIGAVLIGAAFWSSLRHNRLSVGGG